jgi:His-Xaa-Ser system radical SAM maturase HxsC
MILRTKGKSINIENHLVGKVSRDISSVNTNTILLIDDGNYDVYKKGSYLAVLTTKKELKSVDFDKVIYNIPSLDHLEDGDIVWISSDGNINTLYRVNSNQNTLLATERCNSNCLMCSQPPRDRNDIPLLYEINHQLIRLIPKDCPELGISGGEPTLMGDLFFRMLRDIKIELPNTEIHVLTNGRTFAWDKVAAKMLDVNNDRVMFGIPLYSDFYQQHDFIVQAENAFYQTILGIHNLERYGQRVEIRIVLHKQSIPRLLKLAKYIYKNLPFVEHIAFMGLEYIGYTPFNIDKLWIDPYEYRTELTDSVLYLAEKGMNVSIYNTPLCVLPENTWEYARKSISDWKNDYLPECKGCSKLNDCGGFFRWNLKKHSDYIKPFE